MRGLRNQDKRRELFYYFKEKADILCVQESHSVKEDEHIWENEFKGTLKFAHGQTDSRGVFVAIKKNVNCEITQSIADSQGRYIIVQIKVGEEYFIIINLYAPNRDLPSFFLEIFRKAESLNGWKIYIGDFNFVMNVSIDVKTEKGDYQNKEKTKEFVQSYTLR